MRVFHKGLILVSLLLAFELLWFTILWNFLIEAEREAAKASLSRQVISVGDNLTRQLLFVSESLIKYAMSRDPKAGKQFDNMCATIPPALEQFKSLREDKQQLKEITDIAEKIFELQKSCKPIADAPDDPLAIVRLNRVLRKELQPLVDRFHFSMDALISKHMKLTDIPLEREAQAKEMLKIALVIAVLSNIAVAIGTVFLFSKGISRRLAVLQDNAIRLAASRPLNPPQKGNDDLADLDRVFHQMALALQEASAKEKAVSENLPVGLITCSGLGRILAINPRTEELLRCKSEDLVGKLFSTVVSGPDKEQEFGEFIRLTKGRPRQLNVKRVDGSDFPAEVNLSVYEHFGSSEFIVSLSDVSERYQIERLKQEFVAVIGHDLRTPLMSIQGFFQLISVGAFGSLTNKGEQALQGAVKESDRLIKLTSDLLDIAKLEAGKIELTTAIHSVNTLFDRAMNATSYLAATKRVEVRNIECDIDVICDSERIVQVLVNLISNAIKYSGAGETVTLSAQVEGEQVKITVSDVGCGIPAEFQTKIFDRFQQVRTADSKIGSGLGLAICKLIVEAHDGTIGVTSEEGRGSEFWLKLVLASRPSSVAQALLERGQ